LLDVNKTSQGQSRITTTDGSFTVLTDEIIECTTSNDVSYSFLTEPTINPNADYENLVLYKKGDEPFKFYLYSYETIFINGVMEHYFISRLQIDGDNYGLESLGQQLATKLIMDDEGCLWRIEMENGDLVLQLLSCAGNSVGSGGPGGLGSILNNSNEAQPSASDYCGDWNQVQGTIDGKCVFTKGCIDSSGTGYSYSQIGPCNNDETDGNNEGNNNEGNNNEGNNNEGNGEVGTGESGSTGSGPGPGNPTPPSELEEGETVGINTPLPYNQQINLCFSSAGILFNTDDLTRAQQKALAIYLSTDTNCSDPQALAIAHEAAQAMDDGGNVDFNDIIYVLENEQDYTGWMSDDEKNLFDTLTRTEQLLYLTSAKQARDKTDDLYLTFCEKYNGKGDAFRHAYWNALSSSRIGVGLTNLLTTRHENQPPDYPYHWKENEMDLFNNQVGRDIVTNGSTNILQDVIQALTNGDLRYLSNQDSVECEATFNSQLIPTNL
jgi:hypothetical protein